MQDVNLVLADRYQARERLGSGAGAGVEEYLGRDLRLARPVVIQVIRGAGKDGFAPQARLMASLDHPAVASVYDWGQQEGLAYLIRGYVPGQNLGRLLIERGVLPVPQAAAIGAEVAAALAAAHRIGLAHGSLDAADVILGDQRVTVVGFGAAWMREAAGVAPERLDTTRAGGPGATGGPAAPGGREPGAQADLRALGGMLYQMITGASPEQWPMVTPMAGAGLSPPLRQVIERLMAPEPADRYRAAEAVRADLLHLTHGQAASAQPAAPASGKPVPAGSAAAGPASTTAPVRVPADAPPSWVSATQGTARPGSAARRCSPERSAGRCCSPATPATAPPSRRRATPGPPASPPCRRRSCPTWWAWTSRWPPARWSATASSPTSPCARPTRRQVWSPARAPVPASGPPEARSCSSRSPAAPRTAPFPAAGPSPAGPWPRRPPERRPRRRHRPPPRRRRPRRVTRT